MRFLIDAQLPPGLCRWLEARGHQAAHVHNIGLGAASDIEIVRRAETDGAVLISKDEDFLALRLSQRFVLVWLRCGNVTNRALASWLDQRWASVEEMLSSGELLIEIR